MLDISFINAEDKMAGAVFFLAGSRIILYFLNLNFFRYFLICFKYLKFVLIIG